MKLNVVKFRKMAMSFFVCFPNVKNITVSLEGGSFKLQLWKNVNVSLVGVRYGNSISLDRSGRFDSRIHKGMICSIPLNFLGYNTIQNPQSCFSQLHASRSMFKIHGNTKSMSKQQLESKLKGVFSHTIVDQVQLRPYNEVLCKNANGETELLQFRGSGLRTSYKGKINKGVQTTMLFG